MCQRQKANVGLIAQIRKAFVASAEAYAMSRIRASLMDAIWLVDCGNFDFIEGLYNRVHSSSHLDQLSPLTFEQLRTGF